MYETHICHRHTECLCTHLKMEKDPHQTDRNEGKGWREILRAVTEKETRKGRKEGERMDKETTMEEGTVM